MIYRNKSLYQTLAVACWYDASENIWMTQEMGLLNIFILYNPYGAQWELFSLRSI